MKLLILLIMTTVLISCSNLVKSGAIIEAQNALNKNHYSEALENTEIAESFGDLSEADTAKLHYLRAQALDGLGRINEAAFNYQYVVDQHSRSAYARPAQHRLEAIRARLAN